MRNGTPKCRNTDSNGTIELDYGPDGWDHLGVAVSALTLVLLAAFGAHSLRRRRRSAAPA